MLLWSQFFPALKGSEKIILAAHGIRGIDKDR